jgi:ABC-type nickel/cobalt efflux system permease component RcnA
VATAVSHTLGVVALGSMILLAGSALPAERIYPILSAASALLVVGIGLWMVSRQWPVVIGAFRRVPVLAPAHSGGHPHPHGLSHAHDGGHDHGNDHGLGHGHTHPHPNGHDHPEARPIGWRALFALGLSGGLVPSTSALLILVATVATGRPAYGLLLVAAFGVGMAAVLVGLGFALVLAGERLERVDDKPWVATVMTAAPVVGAFVVLGLGVFLTAQAMGGTRIL